MGKEKKKKQKTQSLEWEFWMPSSIQSFWSWRHFHVLFLGAPGFSNLCINPWSRNALAAQQPGYYGAQPPPPGYYQQQQHWPQQPVQVQPPTHQNLAGFLSQYLFVWVLVWGASPYHGESLAIVFSLAFLEAIRWCQLDQWDLQSLFFQMMMKMRRKTPAKAAVWLQESNL